MASDNPPITPDIETISINRYIYTNSLLYNKEVIEGL